MTQNIDEQMEIFTCVFDIEVGNKVNKKIIQAPRMILERKFMSLVKQASYSSSPIKIKMSRIVHIYDNFEHRWIERENSVTFENNAYINNKK